MRSMIAVDVVVHVDAGGRVALAPTGARAKRACPSRWSRCRIAHETPDDRSGRASRRDDGRHPCSVRAADRETPT